MPSIKRSEYEQLLKDSKSLKTLINENIVLRNDLEELDNLAIKQADTIDSLRAKLKGVQADFATNQAAFLDLEKQLESVNNSHTDVVRSLNNAANQLVICQDAIRAALEIARTENNFGSRKSALEAIILELESTSAIDN